MSAVWPIHVAPRAFPGAAEKEWRVAVSEARLIQGLELSPPAACGDQDGLPVSVTYTDSTTPSAWTWAEVEQKRWTGEVSGSVEDWRAVALMCIRTPTAEIEERYYRKGLNDWMALRRDETGGTLFWTVQFNVLGGPVFDTGVPPITPGERLLLD